MSVETASRKFPGTNPIIRSFAHLAKDIFIREETFTGRENAKKVRELLRQGNRVVFCMNHLSHMDTVFALRVLDRNGFMDIEEKVIFLLGQRLAHNPFRFGYRYIDVWPPTMEPKDDQERKKARGMTERAFKDVGCALSNGYVIAIYPEGTRGRGDGMNKAYPQVANYLRLATHVVPIGIAGTEKILPPRHIIPKFGEARIKIGEPVEVANLESSIPAEIMGSERKQMLVDNVMIKVAALLPKKYQGAYSRDKI